MWNFLILGLKLFYLNTSGCGSEFNYCVEKHEELETICIGFKCEDENKNKDQDEILLTAFSHHKLRYISFNDMKNTGDIIGRLSTTLPNLEKL